MRLPSRVCLLALLGLGAIAFPVRAGWLSIKNDTQAPLVIQDAPEFPGQKRVKTIRLLPGEVYREYRPTACEKKIQVFDARCPGKPLFADKLKWKTGDAALKVELAGKEFKLSEVRPLKPAGPSKP